VVPSAKEPEDLEDLWQKEPPEESFQVKPHPKQMTQ
jgi:hypothetical protein